MNMTSGIANFQDVLNGEEQMKGAALPDSTYELICQGEALDPEAPALSFFLTTDSHARPETWSYRQLVRRINQATNFFDTLGASKDTVIAYILPNLPETHFVIWGGQASGIVCAINPLLEASAIAELLNAAEASILVTLAPFPGTDLWPKVYQAIQSVPALKDVVLVSLADHVHGIKGLVAKVIQKKAEFDLHGLHGVRHALRTSMRVHDFNKALDR